MRLGQLVLVSALSLGASSPAVAATHARHSAATAKKLAAHTKPKVIGQRGIEDARATELQAALIQSGYLTGTPSGHWDAQSEAAMTKLQADNGWQTKLVPDSRAIIKLGLGPASADTATATAPGRISAR